ncbi:pilus assembly protein FimV [Oxalobacteraceae bacterium GrIS 1.18]
MQLRSNLGQSFKAQVVLSGVSQNLAVASCFKARLETIDGELLAVPRIDFARLNQDPASLRLLFSTKELIAEPAVNFKLELICDGSIHRDYALLLDYPEMALPSHVTQAEPEQADVPAAALNTVPLARHFTPKSIDTTIDTSTDTGTDTTAVNRPDAADRRAPKSDSKKNPSRFSTKLTLHKDALKISNEEVQSAGLTAPEKPLTLEQQRLVENDLAKQAFAKMLHDEPTQVSTQDALDNAQKKVQALENELAHLKLEVELKNQREQAVPKLLIILSSVLMLLFVAVIAVLAFLLRQSRAGQKRGWWDTAHSKPGVDAESEDSQPDLNSVTAEVLPQKDGTDYLAGPHLDESSEPPERIATLRPGQLEKAVAKSPANERYEESFNLFANRAGQSIQIEEVSDAMQEAEFWMSINDPRRAIEILEPQSQEDHPNTPVMWLCLLDLYRASGEEEKYTRLRHRFKQQFNTHILAFNEKPDSGSIKYLVDFEHLSSKCCAYWNTNYILPYLESLLIDDREGERLGFELSVYQDILMLIAICKEIEKPVEMSA